jgi:UDP-glucuronate 4-epimerase
MRILVTGAAGLIGMHVAQALLARGDAMHGVDSLNLDYNPALKRARLRELERHPQFRFTQADIADGPAMDEVAAGLGQEPCAVVHLAARGTRRSTMSHLEQVDDLERHMAVLELCRRVPGLQHFVYASSVSGAEGGASPAAGDVVMRRADELLAQAYAQLYRVPQTGVRLHTVYGPWGRPDMDYYVFADAIAAGRPITLGDDGRMQCNLTYVDDVVAGVLAALDRPLPQDGASPHRIYELGSDQPVELEQLVRTLAETMGQPADIRYAEARPGDVVETVADTSAAAADLGWRPTTPLADGLRRFVAWYRTWPASR